jgi:hypothetical protein
MSSKDCGFFLLKQSIGGASTGLGVGGGGPGGGGGPVSENETMQKFCFVLCLMVDVCTLGSDVLAILPAASYKF